MKNNNDSTATLIGIFIGGAIVAAYNIWRHEEEFIDDVDNAWKRYKHKRGF